MVTIQRQLSRKSVILRSCWFHSAAGDKLQDFPHHELDVELHLHLLFPELAHSPPRKGTVYYDCQSLPNRYHNVT